MNIKHLLLLAILCYYSIGCITENPNGEPRHEKHWQRKCTKPWVYNRFEKQIGWAWRLDSLGDNGFRYHAEVVVKAEYDFKGLSWEKCKALLGSPNSVYTLDKDNNTRYVYNTMKCPNEPRIIYGMFTVVVNTKGIVVGSFSHFTCCG